MSEPPELPTVAVAADPPPPYPAAAAKEVIAETNGFYKKLLSGETDAGKLWVPVKTAA